MSDYVTRAEFDELAEEVHGQSRTNRVMLRQIGEVTVRVSRMEVLLRRVARHFGIDPNGDES